MTKPDFTIIIDHREKLPYRFIKSKTAHLKSGDYSIEGLEDKIAIERKSKEDAYMTISQHRDRFEKEFKRLSEYDYAAVVIECSLEEFLRPPAFSKFNPKAAVGTLLSWNVKYKVNIFFASGRLYAMAAVYKLLEKYWKHRGLLYVQK